ncbi:MAG: AEC family transporter [Pseudomonadota bacterium]|nr:AEC family transporter [Pseudomonadota bacterium]
MSDALLLLPDVILILAGYAICRLTPLNRPLWDQIERVVYFVLFPALLFHSIVRRPLDLFQMMPLAASSIALSLVGIAAASALRLFPGVDPRLHASGAQTAFRFNSYVALALAERLAGAPGVAWMAVVVSVCVPLCNVAAVWPLARHGGHHYGREIVRNPLIVATASGLAFSLLGLHLPALADISLARIGAAALPLGLMAVGAGLQLGALREGPRLAAALMVIRHGLMPLVAIGIVVAMRLPPGQQAVVVAFSALPTASSCYVLAVRMGGHGGFTAGLVTVSTGIGMLLLPVWLTTWRAWANF